MSPTTSQQVDLNRNASFTCITRGLAQWVINGSRNETSATIYPSDGQTVTPLHGRGFFFLYQQHSNGTINNTLIVLGSFENNNTEIDCQAFDNTAPAPTTTTPALLTVVGMCIILHTQMLVWWLIAECISAKL